MTSRVYCDNAATTPLDPRVALVMEPWIGRMFGNPSSLHREGRAAREAVDRARSLVAGLVGAAPADVVFTGSGTEADNLAILGAIAPDDVVGAHVLTSAFEHPAVLEACRALARRGAVVELLPVGRDGIVDPGEVRRRMRATTRLVSVMAANNVVGTLQPIAAIAELCRERGTLFHTDAVQAAGRIPIDLRTVPVDLLSLSAHKFYGPPGVGMLVIRPGVGLQPLIHGGGQERGLRAATENVAGIAGAGAAASIAAAEMAAENARLVALRERLLSGLAAQIPNCRLIGHPTRRLPGHLALLFDGQEGEAIRLLLALDDAGIAVSTGSACSARHASEPSHVLTAMGFDAIRARGALRITLGRFNSEEHVDRLLEVLPRVTHSMRPVTSRPFASTVFN